jgi:hypothetical protein
MFLTTVWLIIVLIKRNMQNSEVSSYSLNGMPWLNKLVIDFHQFA